MLTRGGILALLASILVLLRVTSSGTFLRNQLQGRDCIVNATSHIGYGGCVRQYAVPLLVVVGLCLYMLVRMCRVLFNKKERLRVSWSVLIFLAAVTAGVYIDGCLALSRYLSFYCRQQASLDSTIDEYYRGNGKNWPGEKTYRSGYSNLLRWQEVVMTNYS